MSGAELSIRPRVSRACLGGDRAPERLEISRRDEASAATPREWGQPLSLTEQALLAESAYLPSRLGLLAQQLG
jgi:hypothetical protein